MYGFYYPDLLAIAHIRLPRVVKFILKAVMRPAGVMAIPEVGSLIPGILKTCFR